MENITSKDILHVGIGSAIALVLAALATLFGPGLGTLLIAAPVAVAIAVYAVKNADKHEAKTADTH